MADAREYISTGEYDNARTSLREALHSPLFTALQSGDILLDDHEGGCVLYEKRELVEALMVQH